MQNVHRYPRSRALYLDALRLIPGGTPRGTPPLLEPGLSPIYLERGKGCRVWDVDGNEFIDYIMAYGAILLGYAHAEVDGAAAEEMGRGKLLSMNHPLHVRFVEAVLRRFPSAHMAHFAKTGSEATTFAVRIARRFTGRPKVIRCGFHGWHDWCFPDTDSVPEGLASQVLPLRSISPAGLERLLSEPENKKSVAAVIVAPEMVLPLERSAVAGMVDVAHSHGALFILDEVKTGLRTRGGSVQQYLNVVPDLTTLSKALGNGWPVSLVIGRREVMACSEGIHLSATFNGETASMAAALKTLEILDREPVQEHVWRLGERLIAGLNALAARHRIPARAYGEPLPHMPFLAFTHPDEAANAALRTAFYGEMFARGVLLHPTHLWYIAYSHTESDIETTLAAADVALERARALLR